MGADPHSSAPHGVGSAEHSAGCSPAIFDGVGNYLAAVFFLTVLPLLAYPLQPILPHYKDQGRAGQRKLAMLMAVAGYVAGAVMGIVCVVPKGLMQIYLIYLISGVLTLLFNKVFKIKASGHACGIAGPVAYLVYFVGWPALAGCIVLAMAYWASLRHGAAYLAGAVAWQRDSGGCDSATCLPIKAVSI